VKMGDWRMWEGRDVEERRFRRHAPFYMQELPPFILAPAGNGRGFLFFPHAFTFLSLMALMGHHGWGGLDERESGILCWSYGSLGMTPRNGQHNGSVLFSWECWIASLCYHLLMASMPCPYFELVQPNNILPADIHKLLQVLAC
jgi:hypothetical protein